jgi:hypothetical protein
MHLCASIPLTFNSCTTNAKTVSKGCSLCTYTNLKLILLRSGGFSIEYVERVLKFSIWNILFLVALAVAVNMANLVFDDNKDLSSQRLVYHCLNGAAQ